MEEQIRSSYPCDACGREPGVYHVTLTVDIFGPKSKKQKKVQGWLGEICEKKNRLFFERSAMQQVRVLKAITPKPEWWTLDTCADLPKNAVEIAELVRENAELRAALMQAGLWPVRVESVE